jgi:hypothetical protein
MFLRLTNPKRRVSRHSERIGLNPMRKSPPITSTESAKCCNPITPVKSITYCGVRAREDPNYLKHNTALTSFTTRTSYWLARTKTPVTCTLAPLAHWLFSQAALMWHNGLGAARGQRLRKEPCASFPTRFLFSRPTGRLTGPLILSAIPLHPILCGSIAYAANEGLTGFPATSRPPVWWV